ncbi:hypothetical protein RAB80_015041 [Fusarium oxysporum f. sp. vasinfectum]|nr:hypothetical protein RAB80_015041 [Fusarium oxysporum f. sp. vasinfectum]
MSTVALSRKRASTPSSPTTNLSKKLKLTSISPFQPLNKQISPARLTTLLNQDPTDLVPDLRMQVTCLKLFLLVISRMPENTLSVKKISPKHRREHEVGYRQAVEALSKLDVLGIATRKMIATVNDIERITKDIDEILEFEAPSFPNVQLKRSSLYHQFGTKFVSEHWYECVLENIWENEKLKAQEKMVREKYYELYHQKGRPRMARDNGYYTRRMHWYAERLFSRENTTEDGPLPVKIVKRLAFLELYGEADVSESDFEQDLSARTDIPIEALRPAGVEIKDSILWIEGRYGCRGRRDS